MNIAFLGFPMDVEGPDKQTVRLLEKHCANGRNVVRFITHASPENNPGLPSWLDQPPPIELLLTTLLNELTTISEDFIIALHDYHIIDSKSVDDALTFLQGTLRRERDSQ